MCDPVLRASVDTLPDPLRRMAGYQFGWCDRAGAPTRTQSGKMMRPALVFGTATACGGSAAAAVHAAAAMELMHNFSLLHDDVMDGDRARRGRATVWCVWGTANAILLGDALQALASRVLAAGRPARRAGEAVGRLEAAVVEMCRGQCEDCAFETRHRVGVQEYLRMAMGKTGALMGCACALGAQSAGADAATIAAMDEFGRQLGLAFQSADDVIGIWGDPQVTGKPAGNDLARRKRSLPVVAALQSPTAAASELAALYRSETPMTPTDVARATALVEAAGGRERAEQYADDQVHAAIDALPDHTIAADLRALAQAVAHRNR
nr:geranylgeranyl diphosphate synthase IdsB [Nocardia terpenica]